VEKRPAIGRMAFKQRVVRLLNTKKSKTVAANIFKGFKKVCREVIRVRGGASRG